MLDDSTLPGHYPLEYHLHEWLVWTLNLHEDLPGAKHRRQSYSLLPKSGDIRRGATLDCDLYYPHIHKLHADAEPYLRICHRIPFAVNHRNDQGIGVTDVRREHEQGD